VTLSLLVPVYALGYWLLRGSSTTLPTASLMAVTLTTLLYALAAAAAGTIAAIPVALYSWRRASLLSRVAERIAYVPRALPGIALALAFVFFAIRYAHPLYQRPPLLVLAYAILYFPLGLTAVRAALGRIPEGLEEVASTLGVRPLRTLGRVTLPLALPGILAGVALIALSASTELTATLLLRPTGVDTLATRFWLYSSGLSYGAAAPYAAVMVLLSVPPVLLLTRQATTRA
jgi:iron(III) transport system permease protein